MKYFVLVAVAAVLLAPAMPAAAVTSLSTPVTFTSASIGDGARLTLSTIVDGKTIDGLGGQVVIHLVGIEKAGTAWNFTLNRVEALVSLPKATSRISSFGFNVIEKENSAFSSATAKGDFATVHYNQSPPQFKESFDLCFAATGNGCNGGKAGIRFGETGSGSFTLNFSQAVNAVRLDNFFARFQSIENVPKVEQGGSGVGVAILMEPIPEPGTWAMMIVGFGLVGASMRQRRHRLA